MGRTYEQAHGREAVDEPSGLPDVEDVPGQGSHVAKCGAAEEESSLSDMEGGHGQGAHVTTTRITNTS